MILERR